MFNARREGNWEMPTVNTTNTCWNEEREEWVALILKKGILKACSTLNWFQIRKWTNFVSDVEQAAEQ